MTKMQLPATVLNAEQQQEGKEGELVQDPGKGVVSACPITDHAPGHYVAP